MLERFVTRVDDFVARQEAEPRPRPGEREQ
jgi:hypothetical protein